MEHWLIYKKIVLIILILLTCFLLYPKKGISSADKIPVPHLDSNSSVVIYISEVPKPTVEELIILKAKEYGINPNIALRIAKCESDYNTLAKSPISSASGVFQFISGTWQSVVKMRGQDYTLSDRFDAEKNIDNAMWLMKTEGLHHWECK